MMGGCSCGVATTVLTLITTTKSLTLTTLMVACTGRTTAMPMVFEHTKVQVATVIGFLQMVNVHHIKLKTESLIGMIHLSVVLVMLPAYSTWRDGLIVWISRMAII